MADEAFDLQKVASEIVLRIYLTIGFVALLVLTAMAVTSTDGMARRLGGRRWRLLHQLVYGAALLSVIHFFMQTKVTVDEPWIMAGLFAWLMAWRAAVWRARSGLPDWLPAASRSAPASRRRSARASTTGSSWAFHRGWCSRQIWILRRDRARRGSLRRSVSASRWPASCVTDCRNGRDSFAYRGNADRMSRRVAAMIL
jgi:hypothetical protein